LLKTNTFVFVLAQNPNSNILKIDTISLKICKNEGRNIC
jgi:hypothetical protein